MMKKEDFNYYVECNLLVIGSKLKDHYRRKGYNIKDDSLGVADVEFPFLKQVQFELQLSENDRVKADDFSYLKFNNGQIFAVVNFDMLCEILGPHFREFFPINIVEQHAEFVEWNN